MISITRFIRSMRAALHGLAIVIKEEQSFQLQLGAAALVFFFMWYFHIARWEAVILSMLVILVLILELINTVFERIIDVLKPRMHSYVGNIKDILAGTVLVASLGALVVGIIILLPYFF